MDIQLFEDDNGKCYVRDFLGEECSKLEAAKLIQKLEDMGEHSFETLKRTRKIEQIEHGLYEVRIPLNKISFRFLEK